MESSSANRCLSIPELLTQITSGLSNRTDISCLSRCDRLFHALVTPVLYRDLRITVENVSALAFVFNTKPTFGQLCRSLTITNPLQESLSAEKCRALRDDLIILLQTIGDGGNLKVFTLDVLSPQFSHTLTADVWNALSKSSGSLEELELLISEQESNWTTLCAAAYPKLRVLSLGLEAAHGWDCSPLQGMLDSLQQLEVLHLNLPFCCGPLGLTLASYHPRLHTLHLSTGSVTGPAAYFLKRHPTIEHLSVVCSSGLVLDDGDLPRLKTLSVDQCAVLQAPALLSRSTERPITHLRLLGKPYLTTGFCFNLVGTVASTLRHLEFQWSIDGFRVSIPDFGNLLKLVPKLVELKIVADSEGTHPEPQPLNSEDLSSFLSSISGATNITQLRLTDPGGHCLTRSVLDDVGVVPQSLMYLSWDVGSQSVTYRLEAQNGRTVAVETGPYEGFSDPWVVQTGIPS